MKSAPSRMLSRKNQLVLGTFLQSISWFLFLALYSYVVVMPDVVILRDLSLPQGISSNWMGKLGGLCAHYLVREVWGISAFLVPLLPLSMSYKLFFSKSRFRLLKALAMISFLTEWVSLAFAYWHYIKPQQACSWYMLPSILSLRITSQMADLLGVGVVLLLAATLISFMIFIPFNVVSFLKDGGISIRKTDNKSRRGRSEDNLTTEEVVPLSASDIIRKEDDEQDSDFPPPQQDNPFQNASAD